MMTTYHAAGQPCADVAVGYPACLGHDRPAPVNAGVRTHSDGITQEQAGASGGLLYRYRCDRCGHTGRWVKDGNLVQEAYENHRFGGIDDGISRCR